jgi:threonine dehydrogenase-like Zn-dependent dehydrogenase
MLELERNGTIDLSALITHTLPFSQLPQGLHLVETRAALKVVITITV